MITILDLTAAVLIIAYIYLIGQKKTFGWLLAIAGTIIYTVMAIMLELYGLLVLNCVLIPMYSRNYLKWRKDENTSDGSRQKRV